MNIIEVQDLNFSYSRRMPLLSDLTFSVEEGSFLAIAGPNGVGKSTLLNLLCASLKPRSGTILLADRPLESYTTATLARQIAVVRQEFVPAFGFSVAETVLMARTPYYGRLGFEAECDRQIVARALEATDTAQFTSRQLAHISGGERQRVFIARALAQQTPVLLLDEPTSFLDLSNQVRVYDLLKKMQTEEKKTIIAITHDLNLASQYCDRVLLLADNAKCFYGEPNDILSPEQIVNVFGVTGHSGTVHKRGFFLPLGNHAADYRAKNDASH